MGVRTVGDIVEMFVIKHSLVCSHYARFTFASATFKPETQAGSDSDESSAGGQPAMANNSAPAREVSRVSRQL